MNRSTQHATDGAASSAVPRSPAPGTAPHPAGRTADAGTRRLHPRTGPGPALALGALILVAWWAVTASGAVPAVFLPGPVDVARRLVLGITEGGLLPYAWVTLREAVLGCLLAAALALPLAWALYRWQLFSRTVLPYVAASQAVPAIAMAPLLVLWIGYGTLPVVILCAFMVFFPITVTVLLGLRGLDADVLDAARLDGASGLALVRYMELPMALPGILSGLRTGFTLSVTGAVVGEMTMGGEGLGMVLSHQRDAVDTTGLFATIVLLCLIATTIHWCLHELERRSRVVDAMRGRRAT
ncbi:ABC transporter permease [Actinomyces radicidentis]|uniref:ABC transporter permease n=1 Tax=Actinomyces radicidentis TaxID=111015 RepID=UPI003F658AB4